MKKTIALLSLLLILTLTFFGCSGDPVDNIHAENTDTKSPSSTVETTETETTTEPIIEESPKNIMIFGDSYSTFEGYIPMTYKAWYRSEGRPETDVKKVEETWWHRICEDKGYNLVMNDSFSGSTLCNTSYNGIDYSNANSFIHRLDVYERKKFFEKNDIDIFFVFGCTNDSWANSPLGEYKTEGITKSDLYNVLPSIPFFIGELKRIVPDAEVVFIINSDLKPEIGDAVKKASAHYGTKYVELTKIQKKSGHPTVVGMASIASQVKEVLN